MYNVELVCAAHSQSTACEEADAIAGDKLTRDVNVNSVDRENQRLLGYPDSLDCTPKLRGATFLAYFSDKFQV